MSNQNLEQLSGKENPSERVFSEWERFLKLGSAFWDLVALSLVCWGPPWSPPLDASLCLLPMGKLQLPGTAEVFYFGHFCGRRQAFDSSPVMKVFAAESSAGEPCWGLDKSANPVVAQQKKTSVLHPWGLYYQLCFKLKSSVLLQWWIILCLIFN